MTAAIEFKNVSRQFASVTAVDAVDLCVQPGEFFAMLGPSGSGKTTCLRLVAGFDQPTSGHVEIFGQNMQAIPPYRRNVNTVFQDYALFPHLSVAENVAYALMIRKVGKRERLSEADRLLEMVQLGGYGERRPAQLSGGQQQRVALARALINEPKVLLLDEPLGALDLRLREQMQDELKSLQRALGITFVFVTHDQGEAFSMADRIAVFNNGKIAQVGTPEDAYHRPATEFVARFVGSSNVLGQRELDALRVEGIAASLRPEAIRLVQNGGYEATVISKSFLGAATRLKLAVHNVELTALVDHDAASVAIGDAVRVAWDAAALHRMAASHA